MWDHSQTEPSSNKIFDWISSNFQVSTTQAALDRPAVVSAQSALTTLTPQLPRSDMGGSPRSPVRRIGWEWSLQVLLQGVLSLEGGPELRLEFSFTNNARLDRYSASAGVPGVVAVPLTWHVRGPRSKPSETAGALCTPDSGRNHRPPPSGRPRLNAPVTPGVWAWVPLTSCHFANAFRKMFFCMSVPPCVAVRRRSCHGAQGAARPAGKSTRFPHSPPLLLATRSARWPKQATAHHISCRHRCPNFHLQTPNLPWFHS